MGEHGYQLVYDCIKCVLLFSRFAAGGFAGCIIAAGRAIAIFSHTMGIDCQITGRILDAHSFGNPVFASVANFNLVSIFVFIANFLGLFIVAAYADIFAVIFKGCTRTIVCLCAIGDINFVTGALIEFSIIAEIVKLICIAIAASFQRFHIIRHANTKDA